MTCVRSCEPSYDIPARTQSFNQLFTWLVYSSVCQSLYERHKLLFGVVMCARLMSSQGRLDPDEWRCAAFRV